MSQSSRWISIGREILFSARTERVVHEPVASIPLLAASRGRRLRYPHARYRHARAVFQRCLALAQQY